MNFKCDIKYPSMFPSAKKDYDPQSIVDNLDQEDARLLSEYLGLISKKMTLRFDFVHHTFHLQSLQLRQILSA